MIYFKNNQELLELLKDVAKIGAKLNDEGISVENSGNIFEDLIKTLESQNYEEWLNRA